MPLFASYRYCEFSTVPSSSTSNSSVQKEEVCEALTDVAPFPTLTFWVVFFAFAPGAGVAALAVNCVPTLTLGAVCCAVCATARMQKASIVGPAKKVAFFIVLLHLKISVIREPLPSTCQSSLQYVVDMPINLQQCLWTCRS